LVNRHASLLITVFCVAAVLLLGCETGVPPDEVAQVYYNLGNAYFELEKYGLATTAYLNALALDDSFPQAGYNLARVYVESEEYEKGLEALSKLLEEDPGNSLILSTIGWTYYLQADYEKALETFQTILERMPTDEHALYNSAVLSLKLERKESALGYFLKLYNENKDSEILYRIAAIYLDLQRWSDASGVLTEYLAEKPEDADAYYDLGIALTAERYYDKALEAFESCIELRKDDPLPYFEKAVILILYIENIDEGLKTLEAAVKAGFNDSEKITALLNAEELLFADELTRFLEEKELLPEEALKESTGVSTGEPSEPEETVPQNDAVSEETPAEEVAPEKVVPDEETNGN